MDIYTTRTLLKLIDQIPSRPSFLRDRYYPNNPTTDDFKTQEVLVEIKDSDRRLAPIVARNVGDVVMARPGETMRAYKPPRVAPARMLTIDDVEQRGFGEALYTDLSADQRAAQYAMRDMQDLSDAITRREEAMAAEVMLTNKCVLKGLADKTDTPIVDVIQYYEGENQATATVSKSWSDPTANIIGDLTAMIQKLQRRGLPAEDFVCAGDVAMAILNNDGVYKMLDNRRYNVGEVAPRLEAPGAAIVAVLNIEGHQINIISYTETYTGDDGKDASYIPEGYGVLTAPAFGSTCYGAITQIEANKQFQTHAGPRIPKLIVDDDNDSRKMRVSARPLLIPNNVDPFVSVQAITD